MARRKRGTHGIEEVVKERNGLPVYESSSPTRPPTHDIRIECQGRLLITNYCHVFAAKKAFEEAIGDEDYKWVDHRTVVTDRGVKVQSNQLEEIVEYEYSKVEHEWDYPDEKKRAVRLVTHGKPSQEEREERNKRLGIDNSAPVKAPREKRESKPRASREGLTSVADIAGELDIEASEARAILRKAKVEKPAAGWAGDEAWAKRIREILKKGKK